MLDWICLAIISPGSFCWQTPTLIETRHDEHGLEMSVLSGGRVNMESLKPPCQNNWLGIAVGSKMSYELTILCVQSQDTLIYRVPSRP